MLPMLRRIHDGRMNDRALALAMQSAYGAFTWGVSMMAQMKKKERRH
jgi:hypothetical protein